MVRIRTFISATLLLLSAVATIQAQSGPPAGEVETDPIKCWWKTDRTSVRAGEAFALTLTCAVIETSTISVIPTTTQLDPGAIQITPFDVVGGARREDVVSPPWRYVQYDYQVRLLGEGFFGSDVTIPSTAVTYNIKSNSTETQGRDLQYMLPALPIRVLSLVPQSAADIRDTSNETFEAIESRRFQAQSAYVTAAIFFALAGVLLVVGLARIVGRVRAPRAASERLVPMPIVLGAALRALRDVRGEAAGGWTPAQARRALAALRIGAAVAIGKPVAQATVDLDAPEREGQVMLTRGWLRRQRIVLSAATTPQAIDRHLATGRPAASVRPSLEVLREALALLGSAGYGRGAELDAAALTNAVDQGADAINRLRWQLLIPARRPAVRQVPRVA